MTCHIPEGQYHFEEVYSNRERSSGERLKREMGLEHWKRQKTGERNLDKSKYKELHLVVEKHYTAQHSSFPAPLVLEIV